MKRTMWMVLIALAAALWAVDSGADWFKKKGGSGDRQCPVPHRYGDVPRCTLLSGELTQDSPGGWRLGGVEVVLLPECRIEVGGQAADLVPAAEAMVLGSRVGSTILARQIRIHGPGALDYKSVAQANSERYGIVWSDSNPAVGVGTIRGVE